jgi:cytochrome c551
VTTLITKVAAHGTFLYDFLYVEMRSRSALTFIAFILGCLLALWQTRCQLNQHHEGQLLYKTHCANCHGEDGLGLGLLIPAVAGSDYLVPNRDQLACMIRYGLADTIVVNGQEYGGQPMPANAKLNAIQITNVLNYIGQNWGNTVAPFQLKEIEKALETCKK